MFDCHRWSECKYPEFWPSSGCSKPGNRYHHDDIKFLRQAPFVTPAWSPLNGRHLYINLFIKGHLKFKSKPSFWVIIRVEEPGGDVFFNLHPNLLPLCWFRCSKAVAMIFGFIQELMNFTKWAAHGPKPSDSRVETHEIFGSNHQPETKHHHVSFMLIFLFVYEKLGWILWLMFLMGDLRKFGLDILVDLMLSNQRIELTVFSKVVPKMRAKGIWLPQTPNSRSSPPLPLRYNLPEIAGLMIGAY